MEVTMLILYCTFYSLPISVTSSLLACHTMYISIQSTTFSVTSLSLASYTVVSCIYAPFAYKPSLYFQPKFLRRYFYLTYRAPNHGHSTKMILVETPTLSSLRSPWQRKKEANVDRRAKEFAIDRKRVREWCQSATAHWKDKPAECLENAAVYAVANLCQSILTIEFLELGGRQN